jgi:hypothetical protein
MILKEARMREIGKSIYKILVRKLEEKTQLRRPRRGHRWEDELNIKMNLKEIGCESVYQLNQGSVRGGLL